VRWLRGRVDRRAPAPEDLHPQLAERPTERVDQGAAQKGNGTMSRDYVVNGYDILTMLPVETGWCVTCSSSTFKRTRFNPEGKIGERSMLTKEWKTWDEVVAAPSNKGVVWVTPKGLRTPGYWFDLRLVKDLDLKNESGKKIVWVEGRPCEVGSRGDWSSDLCGKLAVENIPYGQLWMQDTAKNRLWVCGMHRGVQARRQAKADERRQHRDEVRERVTQERAADQASIDWARRLAEVGVEAEGAWVRQGGNNLVRVRVKPEVLYGMIDDVIGMLRDMGVDDHPFKPIEVDIANRDDSDDWIADMEADLG
jgi:hypothetical protein